ncbi:hypothetical protein F4819DRAFT_454540 [Hypoxylon fuscum]|nr:hypothetical protein F4819DRAFT_454540 [Hypoxylon fuscum]
MANISNKSACNGTTPSKPNHHFSYNPPTAHPATTHDLRSYSLKRFKSSPNSVPLAHAATHDPHDAETTHQARIVAELDAILPRLP